jgi:hypothetical protein
VRAAAGWEGVVDWWTGLVAVGGSRDGGVVALDAGWGWGGEEGEGRNCWVGDGWEKRFVE